MLKHGSNRLKWWKQYKNKFIADVVLPLSKNFEINFEDWSLDVNTVELDFRSKQIYLTEQYNYLIITPPGRIP